MLFSDILGQEKAVSYLQKLARRAHVSGAMLFYGPDGVGKKQTALAFAKALNCEDAAARQQGTACGVCATCQAIDKGTYPDVTLIDFVYQARLEMKTSAKDYDEELDKTLLKQQHINVNTIRTACTKAQQKAFGTGWKVLIIDQAQTMLPAAANALLKLIEEPPEKTLWILITDKRDAMLSTIRSRCQPVAFVPLREAHIKTILQVYRPGTAHLDLAARYGGGSISGTLHAAEVLEILEQGDFGSLTAPVKIAAALPRTLVTARETAHHILNVLTTALHRAWVNETDRQKQTALQKTLLRFAAYKRAIGRNVSPALVLETALMSLDGLQLSIF
jgi:DNA polymerase-3 subunit delta'